MIYSIWLQERLGFAVKNIHQIFDAFVSPFDIYKADKTILMNSGVFTPAQIKSLLSKDLKNAEKTLEFCKSGNVEIIDYFSEKYPDLLKSIPDSPILLFVRGTFPEFDTEPTVAVVGPRNVTDFGYKSAYSLSGRLSRAGFTVISGGAVGADSAAHLGCLLNGERTVAVLACGFNCDYLKVNADLRERIKNNGCLITEFPPDTPVYKNSFHIRNRLMSGLSRGTIVVEAAEKSGALITAHHAAEQGRDVFVIPGNPSLHQYKGSNILLREGAKPLIDLSDVFNEYIYAFADKINIEKAYSKPLVHCPLGGETESKKCYKYTEIKKENQDSNEINAKKSVKIEKNLPDSLSNAARIVYNNLDMHIFTCDDLISEALNSNDVMSALGELEISGLIESLPGGRYSLK